MQRLIEQPTGEGDVFAGVTRLGRVHYHLSVYQHFSAIETDSVPASLDVEGRIVILEAVDPGALLNRHSEMTLSLADGRRLEFSVVDPAGTIRSTGRSLYQS